VKEEIDKKQKEFKFQIKKDMKLRVLIACEVAELAFKEGLITIAEQASLLCLQWEFNVQKDLQLVIAQSKAHFTIAQCTVEKLLDENMEVGFDGIELLEPDNEWEYMEEEK